jgi:hypothetical protein
MLGGKARCFGTMTGNGRIEVLRQILPISPWPTILTRLCGRPLWGRLCCKSRIRERKLTFQDRSAFDVRIGDIANSAHQHPNVLNGSDFHAGRFLIGGFFVFWLPGVDSMG